MTVMVCILSISTSLRHRIDPQVQQYINAGAILVLTLMTLYQVNVICISTTLRRLCILMFCGLCWLARQNSHTTLYWLLIASFVVFVSWTQKDNIRAKLLQQDFNQMCYGNDTFDGLSRSLTNRCGVHIDDNYNSDSMVRLQLIKLLLKLNINSLHIETVRKVPIPVLLNIIYHRMALYNITSNMLDKKSSTFLFMLMDLLDDYPSVRAKMISQRTSAMSAEHLFVLVYGLKFGLLSVALMVDQWDRWDQWAKTKINNLPLRTHIVLKILFDIDYTDTDTDTDTDMDTDSSSIDRINGVLQQWNMNLNNMLTIGSLQFVYLVCGRVLQITLDEKQLFAMEQRSIMALFWYVSQQQNMPPTSLTCYDINKLLKTNNAKQYDDLYKSTSMVRMRLQSQLQTFVHSTAPTLLPSSHAGKHKMVSRKVLHKNKPVVGQSASIQIGGNGNIGVSNMCDQSTSSTSALQAQQWPVIRDQLVDTLQDSNPDIIVILTNASEAQKSILIKTLELGLEVLTPLTDTTFEEMHDNIMDVILPPVTDDERALLNNLDLTILESIPMVRSLGRSIKVNKLANLKGEHITSMTCTQFKNYINLILEENGRPYTYDDLIGNNFDKILVLEKNNQYVDINYVQSTSLQDIVRQSQWKQHNVQLTPLMHKTLQSLHQCSHVDVDLLVGLSQCQIILLKFACLAGVNIEIALKAIHVKGKLELLIILHNSLTYTRSVLGQSNKQDSQHVQWDDLTIASNSEILAVFKKHVMQAKQLNQRVDTFTQFVSSFDHSPIQLQISKDSLLIMYQHHMLVLIMQELVRLAWMPQSLRPSKDDASIGTESNTLEQIYTYYEQKCKLGALMVLLDIVTQHLVESFGNVQASSPTLTKFKQFENKARQILHNKNEHYLVSLSNLLVECLQYTTGMLVETLLFPQFVIEKVRSISDNSVQELLFAVILHQKAYHITHRQPRFESFVSAIIDIEKPHHSPSSSDNSHRTYVLSYMLLNPSILDRVNDTNTVELILEIIQTEKHRWILPVDKTHTDSLHELNQQSNDAIKMTSDDDIIVDGLGKTPYLINKIGVVDPRKNSTYYTTFELTDM